jgi:hypothetical protein
MSTRSDPRRPVATQIARQEKDEKFSDGGHRNTRPTPKLSGTASPRTRPRPADKSRSWTAGTTDPRDPLEGGRAAG